MNAKLSPIKKIAAVHDLSGVGRCSLSVIIPVLSSMGFQVCPLPTAVLSSDSGEYAGFTFLDLTREMPKITAHWNSIGLSLDAVYTGFLGSAGQITHVSDFAAGAKKRGAVFLADPVMGDHGKLYSTYTDEMCSLVAELVKHADIITPNMTEASILLKNEYQKYATETEIRDMLTALSDAGAKKVVLTSALQKDNEGNQRIGSAYFDKRKKEFGYFFKDYINAEYPGTGDVFSSVLLGAILSGAPLKRAVRDANDFTYDAVRYTYALGTPAREGLAIEALWGRLNQIREERDSDE